MEIFITGDTHGDFRRFRPDIFYEQEHMTKEDLVLVCGDFGGIWYGDPRDDAGLDWLDSLPYTTAFVLGNHENYDAYKGYPKEEWHGGQIQRIRPSVLHLMRGQVYELGGRKLFTMGGASSHDIQDGILEPDDPESILQNTITPATFCAADGVDYSELAPFDGTEENFFNAEKALEYKAKAMEELTAAGCTFPVTILLTYKSGDTDWENESILFKQQLEGVLGTDYINVELYAGPSESFLSATRRAGVYSMMRCNWGADYADISNFLGQEILHDDNAYYAHEYSYIAEVAEDPKDYQKELLEQYEEFTRLYNEANAIVDDTDARYEAFAKAEAYFLEKVLCMPSYYEIGLQLTHVNLYSKINTLCGIAAYKYTNWETSTEAYTADDFAAFAEAYEASKGA